MIQRELIKFFKLDKMKSAEINYSTKIVYETASANNQYIAKKKEQDKASGVDVEETEIDVLPEEIIEKEKYYE